MPITYVFSDFDMELSKQNDGDILMDTDIDSIENSIGNILRTRRGSRRWYPTFGSMLEQTLFEPMDKQTAHLIGIEILNAIQTWEPRVSVNNINVYPNYDYNQYDIHLSFSVIGLNRNIGTGTLSFVLKRV
jgi:hypothetical protein